MPCGSAARRASRTHCRNGGSASPSTGWDADVEVSFSEFGERGSIDVFGSRRDHAAVAVCEVKSVIGSLEETNRVLDAKERLAPAIAFKRLGWRPAVVGRLLILPGDSTNRRIVAGARINNGRDLPSSLTRSEGVGPGSAQATPRDLVRVRWTKWDCVSRGRTLVCVMWTAVVQLMQDESHFAKRWSECVPMTRTGRGRRTTRTVAWRFPSLLAGRASVPAPRVARARRVTARPASGLSPNLSWGTPGPRGCFPAT